MGGRSPRSPVEQKVGQTCPQPALHQQPGPWHFLGMTDAMKRLLNLVEQVPDPDLRRSLQACAEEVEDPLLTVPEICGYLRLPSEPAELRRYPELWAEIADLTGKGGKRARRDDLRMSLGTLRQVLGRLRCGAAHGGSAAAEAGAGG